MLKGRNEGLEFWLINKSTETTELRARVAYLAVGSSVSYPTYHAIQGVHEDTLRSAQLLRQAEYSYTIAGICGVLTQRPHVYD